MNSASQPETDSAMSYLYSGAGQIPATNPDVKMKIEEEIHQKKFTSQQQKAAVNLFFTYSWLAGKQSVFLKQFDLSLQQFNILRILRGQHPKPASITLLKERMLDKNSDVSRLIDRMVAKEVVGRAVCPESRRQMDISITEKGLSVLSQIDSRTDEFHSPMTSLSEAEATQLSDLLDKLRSAE